MTGRKQSPKGEDDRESARRYDEDARHFVESGQVDERADEARKAVEGEEGPDLAAAERRGKAKAKEFDPSVARDFNQPTMEVTEPDEPRARERLRVQLDELERQINHLTEQSKKFSDERRSEITQRIETLRQKTRDARASIAGLQSSTSEAWDDISSGLSEAWRSLDRAFKQAGGRFR